MEFLNTIANLSNLPFWSKFADLHGLWAMIALILFGAGIILFYVTKRNVEFVSWLKTTLGALFAMLVLLDIFGLTVYIPYRAVGGPRTILKASEATKWFHSAVFEHKEFLAFAPVLIILVAFIVTSTLGKNFNNEKVSTLRKSVIFSLIIALIFVLVVAGEGVIVTKVAPVK